MTVATHYPNKYFRDGNGVATGTIPVAPAPGVMMFWDDELDLATGAQLAIADKLVLARMPGNHLPHHIEAYIPEWDAGAVLRVNFGFSDDPDYLAAALDVDAAGVYTIPASLTPTTGMVGGASTEMTSAPSAPYDLEGVLTAAADPATATAGTMRYRLFYFRTSPAYDSVDGPAVVAGTQ